MDYEFNDDLPLYKQLVDKIKIAIITDYYKAGEKLPSVRDLSVQIKINPNTIQRALAELEDDKLIYTKRTAGKYVTDDLKVISNLKHEIAKSKIDNFIEDMKVLNFSDEEIIKLLKERIK